LSFNARRRAALQLGAEPPIGARHLQHIHIDRPRFDTRAQCEPVREKMRHHLGHLCRGRLRLLHSFEVESFAAHPLRPADDPAREGIFGIGISDEVDDIHRDCAVPVWRKTSNTAEGNMVV
jgi:hypothetical protein